MKIYRIISFVLVLSFALLSFAACGDDKGDESSSLSVESVVSDESAVDVTSGVSNESEENESSEETEVSEEVVEFDVLKGDWLGVYTSLEGDGSSAYYCNLLNVSFDGKGNGVENFATENGENREFMYSVTDGAVAFVYLDNAEVVSYDFICVDGILTLDAGGGQLNFVPNGTEGLLVPQVDSEILGSWYRVEGEYLNVVEFKEDFTLLESYGEGEESFVYHTYGDGTFYLEFAFGYTYEVDGDSLVITFEDDTFVVYKRVVGDVLESLDFTVVGCWFASDEAIGDVCFVFAPDGSGYAEMFGYRFDISYMLSEGNGINITMLGEGVSEELLDGVYELNGTELTITVDGDPMVFTKLDLTTDGDGDNTGYGEVDLTPAENVSDTIYGMWASPVQEDGVVSLTVVLALRQDGTGFMTAKDFVVEDYDLTEEEMADLIVSYTHGFSFTVEENIVTIFDGGEQIGSSSMVVDGDDMIVVTKYDDGTNDVMYFNRIVE